jgi:hypothetical protein
MKGQPLRGYDGPNTSEIGCRGFYRLSVIVGGMYEPVVGFFYPQRTVVV